jgi:hypothetical protein
MLPNDFIVQSAFKCVLFVVPKRFKSRTNDYKATEFAIQSAELFVARPSQGEATYSSRDQGRLPIKVSL